MNLKLTTAKLTAVLVPLVVTGAVMVSSAAADPGAAGAQPGSPGVLSGNIPVLSGNIVAPGGIPNQAFEVDNASHHSTQRPAAKALDAGVDLRVQNESIHPIRLLSTMGPFDSRPAFGALLSPGDGSHDFVMSSVRLGEADYDVVGDDGAKTGSFRVEMRRNQDGSPLVQCQTTVGTCSIQATTVTLH
jgi:hypothetical protein